MRSRDVVEFNNKKECYTRAALWFHDMHLWTANKQAEFKLYCCHSFVLNSFILCVFMCSLNLNPTPPGKKSIIES